MSQGDIIRSLAETYSEAELRQKIEQLTRELAENPWVYTGGSSGGGTSYTRQERMSLEERLTLLRKALAYLLGDVSVVESVGRARVIFR